MAGLVERYLENPRRHSSSEAQVRLDFIDPFFEALGWDLGNRQGLSQFTREVRIEESVELADDEDTASVGAAGNPDYTFQPEGRRRFFVEAKKPSVRIDSAKAPAYQTRRYGWSAGLAVSVLTNFEQLAIYDCRIQPRSNDGAATARLPGRLYSCEEYVERFDELWRALSKESVLDGGFDEAFDVDRELRGEDSFDDLFLDQIRRWRLELAGDIARRNSTLGERAIARGVQRLINRLVFLRVCEDRNLEEYGQLLDIDDRAGLDARFREADRIYDAGFFDAIGDIEIDPDLLHRIIGELYYPQSPYVFSVVDAPILAAIYEQFLAERLQLGSDRSVELKRKPELAHAGGIVPTPDCIVDAILDRTLAPALAPLSAAELPRFRLVDLACGSGVFLLRSFRRILEHLESQGVVPDLAVKHAILRNNIFGVDIDSEAIEVTAFNLLIAVLDGEDRDSISRFGAPALPNLDAQIVSGNSLITPHFFEVFPEARLDRAELLSVNALDFDQAFPGAMGEGGFDVVVGNPPYVRIQTQAAYEPLQVAYFQQHSPFRSARSHNFDKSLLFIERALDLLKEDGRFGFVVPHRFMSTLPGQAIRELLSEGRHVAEIVHFGHEQVFPGLTTYVCILAGTKSASDAFRFTEVDDLASWRRDPRAGARTLPAEDLTAGPWSFGADEARAVFDRLRDRHQVRLADVADIFVGVQTSADDIFFLVPDSVGEETIRFTEDDAEWEIERAICRPALRDRTLLPYDGRPDADAWAIFPYEIDDQRKRPQAKVFPPQRMEADFPLAWRYLKAHREELEDRSISPSTPETWYRYGRSQSLTKLDGEKIVIRVLSLVPQYNWDPEDLLAPGGGDGGPYGFLRPSPDSGVPLMFLIALLSHPGIDAMVWEASGRAYRGGYFPHRKAFLEDLPVPLQAPEQVAEVATATQALVDSTIRYRHETDVDVCIALARDRAQQRARIEEHVTDLLGLTADDMREVVGA
ncbi:MAG: Eco57I restriction-modification methylase domain-containing protein [Chloroflexota bacterium]